MTQQTAHPFDEQVVSFPEKEQIPELVALEVHPHNQEFTFNGSIFKANSSLFAHDTFVANNVLMKPNCHCAISQSNKRFLDSIGLATDYMEPNPLLFRSLGFPEHECKILVYSKKLDMIPLDFFITGYKENDDNSALSSPVISYKLKTGIPVSRQEAIKLLADWFYDNDYCTNFYTEMMEYENIEEALAFAGVSAEAQEYGKLLCEDNAWEALEMASLYELAARYLDDVSLTVEYIYTNLARRYADAGVLLVNTSLSFGFDYDCDLCLGSAVGTPDTSLLASKELYEKHGTLDSMVEAPVVKYFAKVGYTGGKEQELPELPEDVLDEVSDTFIYLAEALCDDLAFEIHM